MTVAELIAELMKCEPTRIIVMSRDAEGNGYEPLRNIADDQNYLDGEIGFGADAELPDGYSEEDRLIDGQPAVVFWP